MHMTMACEALLGFAGGFLYAISKLQTALCAGDTEPGPQARRRAWVQFCTYLYASPLITAIFTDPLVALLAPHASWPAVAVALGLVANALWPIFVTVASDEFKTWLTGVFNAIRGAKP